MDITVVMSLSSCLSHYVQKKYCGLDVKEHLDVDDMDTSRMVWHHVTCVHELFE